MVTPDARRDAVAHLCAGHGVSPRRACEVLAVDRSSIRYQRIHIMLERQGIVMNMKKFRRLYREEKLQVRKRGGRKRALGTLDSNQERRSQSSLSCTQPVQQISPFLHQHYALIPIGSPIVSAPNGVLILVCEYGFNHIGIVTARIEN